MLSWIKNLINKDANNTEKEESYKRMFMFGDNNGAIPLHYVAHHSNIVAILDKIFYEADEVFFSCEELCERLKTLNLTSNVLLKEWIEQKENKKMIGKAITSCALVGRLEYVQFFESLGVDLNIHNDQDETPLHAAAAGGQIEVADYLLNSGVNVNYSHFSNQSQNWTPLFEAVLHDKRPIVELLLSSRAEYSKRCKKKSRFGLSQLNMNDVAAASGNVSLLQLFVKMGVPIEKTAIYWGCYGGNVSIIMFLLEKGLLLRERNLYDFSKTTLHASCERGCTIATEFIASKAPRLVNVADKNGNTPLHYCAFISAPPSKRAANATGVKYSHSENVVQTLIDSLIRNGADITIKNNDGKLALDLFESTSLATFLEDKYDATFNTQRQLLFEVKELQDRLAKLEDLVIKQNTTIQNQAATIEDMKNNMVVAPPVSPPKLYKQVKFADNIAQIVEYEVLESESSSEDGDPPDVDDDEDEDY
jgi:ankyrin repeat protein